MQQAVGRMQGESLQSLSSNGLLFHSLFNLTLCYTVSIY